MEKGGTAGSTVLFCLFVIKDVCLNNSLTGNCIKFLNKIAMLKEAIEIHNFIMYSGNGQGCEYIKWCAFGWASCISIRSHILQCR